MGSIVSSNASLYLVTPPIITSQTLPTNQIVIYQTNLTLSVEATASGQFNGFPLSYQWQLNGTSILGANGASYPFEASAGAFGTYSVCVSNAVGSTNVSWQVSPFFMIWQQPTDQYQIAGGNVTFVSSAIGSNTVTYQWSFDGTNIAGATNAALTLNNVQAAQQGCYNVLVSDSVTNLTSSNASFYLVTPPVIYYETILTNGLVPWQSNLTLNVTAWAPGQTNGFPLSYQWQFDGTNISWATSSNYTIYSDVDSGTYSVIVTNAAGGTNVSWQVIVLIPGSVWGWGDNSYGQCDPPPGLTNVAALATGEFHSDAVGDNGSVIQWGYNFGDVPADLTNAIAVAAGYEDSIAVRSDGTVVAWGANTYGETNVPANLAGVKAVAAGWEHNVALLTNGTVVAWGLNEFGQTNVPPDLTNVMAISACSFHNLALKSDGTVEGWGYNYENEIVAPAGLSNVVAIAAGFEHSLALKADGTVTAWGDDSAGQCDVPLGLSNVMAVAAGWWHSAALKNDGTVVCWGDNSAGQTNLISGLNNVKLIAAAGYQTIADVFSPLVQYPVDVTKNLLLIYNTNSADSAFVKDYYLAHRPMVSGANVLGVGYNNSVSPGYYETITPTDLTNQIFAPVLDWLAANPTKRPQYVILFLDMPSRVYDNATFPTNGYYPGYDPSVGQYPSVSVQLGLIAAGWQPFAMHINMGTTNTVNRTNDCIGYINKIEFMGTNHVAGGLMISASSGRYGNTNYYFDDTVNAVYSIVDGGGLVGEQGVIRNGASSNAVEYINDSPDPYCCVNSAGQFTYEGHITNGVNVAGYLSYGSHSSLGNLFANNGAVQWSGNSGWWIIETIESFNGQLYQCCYSTVMEWYASGAFGGTAYSNTPVGAISNTDEPGADIDASETYFGLWQEGKSFSICAWNAKRTVCFQAVGDPFVQK